MFENDYECFTASKWVKVNLEIIAEDEICFYFVKGEKIIDGSTN